MDSKAFKTINGLDLIIKFNKSNIQLELDKNEESKDYKFLFNFTEEVFNELYIYLESLANNIWSDFKPKEATNLKTDYTEYYDRELDNNGCIAIRKNSLFIERPSLDSTRLYKFNKWKIESFLYDLKKNLS